VAAIGIGGPVTRVTPGRIADLSEVVMTAARGLSRRLGAHQSVAYTTATPVRVRTTVVEAAPLARPAAL
jgi:hypothetical protein